MGERIEQLRALAERLEKATGPDRELDDAIVGTLVPHARSYVNVSYPELRNLTASIDAALALAKRMLPWLKDFILRSHGTDAEPTWEFTIEHRFVRDLAAPCGVRGTDGAFAPNAPLAILRALVAALIAKEVSDV